MVHSGYKVSTETIAKVGKTVNVHAEDFGDEVTRLCDRIIAAGKCAGTDPLGQVFETAINPDYTNQIGPVVGVQAFDTAQERLLIALGDMANVMRATGAKLAVTSTNYANAEKASTVTTTYDVPGNIGATDVPLSFLQSMTTSMRPVWVTSRPW